MEKAQNVASSNTNLPKIDVIIPAFNAHDTLFRCLSSIAFQTIKDDIEITIVDDCSSSDYGTITNCFKDYMKINVLRLEENKGPGYARQYGREHTRNPLLTFIDADDTFNSSIALQNLRLALITDPKSHCCFGTFIEEQPLPNGTFQYLPHQNDSVWIFGKLYSRAFLDKYHIYMNGTRSNEDTGFNALIKLCSTPNEQIKFIGDVVYIWHATKDSITRANDCDYSFNASFDGYTDNMIWAIGECKKQFPFRENTNYFIVEVLANLYFYYIETLARKKCYAEKNLNACKRFYSTTYKQIENLVNEDTFAANYNVAARNFYGLHRNEGFVPKIDIWKFLELIKEPIKPIKEPTKAIKEPSKATMTLEKKTKSVKG